MLQTLPIPCTQKCFPTAQTGFQKKIKRQHTDESSQPVFSPVLLQFQYVSLKEGLNHGDTLGKMH